MKRPDSVIVILAAVAVAVGLLTYRGYGESWDVNSLRHYADASLDMYTAVFSGRGYLPEDAAERLALGNYGPAHVMLVRLLERALEPAGRGAAQAIPHLVYFLTFLVGLIAFYSLCRRWLDQHAGIGATLLLALQPVMWGHAFINPKDVPLLAFFLIAIAAGFRMVDQLQPLPRAPRAGALVLLLLPLAGVFLGSRAMFGWIESSVGQASSGGSNLLLLIASDIATAAPTVYVQKLSGFFTGAALTLMLIWVAALLLISRRLWRPLYSVLAPIVPAAALLGFVGAIRNLGLWAGVLVAGYALWRHRGRALLPLLWYMACSGTVLYVLWPYLWLDPMGNLYESVRVMSRYPWTDPVLFNGVQYLASDLPASYLPVLLGIQITEPVWLLFAAGLVGACFAWRQYRDILLLAGAWLAAPLLTFAMIRPVLYDNFRQILFLLPPIFLVAGIAIQRIRSPRLASVAILVSVLPGVIGIAKLRPYEYTYYNSLVGGVSGAFRKFELDYWATSYREAAELVNALAVPNANVWVEGPAHLFAARARDDLHVFSTGEVERAESYDFIIAMTRYDLDQTSFPEARVIESIGRGSALFTVIKQP